MTTFVLIPGAGGDAFYWNWVVPELDARGNDTIAVDLPGSDASAGIVEYADAVVRAATGHQDLVVVAQSMGGFTAPLVCDRLDVRMIILVNPMVPQPGENAGDWWGNTGQADASRKKAAEVGLDPDAPFDFRASFFHDVPAEVTEQVLARGERQEADIAFEQPWPLDAWPDVPTHVLAGRDDRFFPVEFQRRVTRERLGLDIEEMPGGHLPAFSQPTELAARLSTRAR